MAKLSFQKLLSSSFYPLLREAGFRGSGSTLRRLRDDVIHVFNVQGSSTGDRCYINLGAHLPFLPSAGGGAPPAPSTIKEYECAFRTRVEPPEKYGFGWPYAEGVHALPELVAAYSNSGEAFFSRWASFPESFVSTTPETFASGQALDSASPLTFAQIALHLADVPRAQAFAQVGLDQTPVYAVLLRKAYDLILNAA